jgi:hypothetical protein
MNAIIGRFSALSGSFGNPPAWPGPLATTWRPQGNLELWAGPSFCPAQHVSLPPRAPAAPRVATRRRSPETHPFISPLHDPSMVRTAVSTAAPDCTAAPIALRLRLHCGSDCTAAPIALRLRPQPHSDGGSSNGGSSSCVAETLPTAASATRRLAWRSAGADSDDPASSRLAPTSPGAAAERQRRLGSPTPASSTPSPQVRDTYELEHGVREQTKASETRHSQLLHKPFHGASPPGSR